MPIRKGSWSFIRNAGEANLKIINQNAQMATDSTFAQIYVESRAKFLELPTTKRYYEVKFFLSKEPHAALNNCKIIVDGDDIVRSTFSWGREMMTQRAANYTLNAKMLILPL
jgi:hypothetical protein